MFEYYGEMKKNYDWTATYRKWDHCEVDDEPPLDPKTTSDSDLFQYAAHQHDHSVEREFFERPEIEKIKQCERHRIRGNYLFNEGNWKKAIEQYNIALSLYEYCFPDLDTEQLRIDELRRACLCNLSLCQLRLKSYREAIEAASQVIEEDPENAKAYFRRAQAYRGLDEYE